ncbi:MAG: polysaccharide deacetylase family protein [Desulfohalobiaceae bacterium]
MQNVSSTQNTCKTSCLKQFFLHPRVPAAAFFLVFWLVASLLGPVCLQAAAGQADESAQGAGQIKAFVYHHFGMQDKYPSTSVSLEQFQDHLDYLKTHDYKVLTLGEALERLYSAQELPKRTAVITIDDGYSSIWDQALPLLEEYGYPASIFVATSHVGGKGYLSWEELKKLHEKGFEIGNHSHSHAYFLDLEQGELEEAFAADLKKSHAEFERHLGSVPDLYAYPYGEYTPEMMSILEDQGYLAAAAQHSGVISSLSRGFALPRFPMNLNYANMEGFREKLGMNALQVTEAVPESPLVSGENPPRLKLRIENQELNPDELQCFVSGQRDCSLDTVSKDDALELEVQATSELSARRTLYTITGPSKDGSKWFWHSQLWVIPGVPE